LKKTSDGIYKYSAISVEAIENLDSAALWFSSPLDFKDKLDSNLPILDVDIKILTKKYEADLKTIPIELLTHLETPKGLFNKHENRKVIDFQSVIDDFKRDCVGITCFSKTGINELMWDEYADKNRGFCLCFETIEDPIFFKDIIEISYKKELPRINYDSDDLVKELIVNYTTKLDDLNYEEEFRLFKHNSGLHKYKKISLKGIVLGEKIDFIDAHKIKEIIKKQYQDKVLIKIKNAP
jgi:hypothetical protein